MNVIAASFQLTWDWSRVRSLCAEHKLHFAIYWRAEIARVEVHLWGQPEYALLNRVYMPSPDLADRVLEDCIEQLH